jgi:hypothetical protein
MRTVTTLPVTERTVGAGHWDTNRQAITTIVIHTMVGTVASADATFNSTDPNTPKVSAHYGVGYDGTIYHWVDETYTAYHAGDYPTNLCSIGIEHEDMGNFDAPRPDALYAASGRLVKDICTYYNIPVDRNHIKKHLEVDTLPGGTPCPHTLDVDRIIQEATTAPPVAPQPSLVEEATKCFAALGAQPNTQGAIFKAYTIRVKAWLDAGRASILNPTPALHPEWSNGKIARVAFDNGEIYEWHASDGTVSLVGSKERDAALKECGW